MSEVRRVNATMHVNHDGHLVIRWVDPKTGRVEETIVGE